MTKQELLIELNSLYEQECSEKHPDCESIHIEADQLLLKFINDKDIEQSFERLTKWYS